MRASFKGLLLSVLLCLANLAYADINDEINNAHLLIYEGKYAQAESTYTQLMTSAAGEFIAGTALVDVLHVYRGIARLIQHKTDAAQIDIQRAFHPESSLMYEDSGYVLRARLRLMQGDKKGAFEDYDALIKCSEKGMISGYRRAMAYAQRGWAHLLFQEQEAAKTDFQTAIAIDTIIMGDDFCLLQKPFWQAIVTEVIPKISTHDDASVLQAIDEIIKKQHITSYPFSPQATMEEKNSANALLLNEIYGPAFLLREKVGQEKTKISQANMTASFTSAQQALIKGDKQQAFNAFVYVFQHASTEDRSSRNQAVQGMAGIIRSGFTPPLMNETTRRLVIKAQVIAQEKAYQEAIQTYWKAIQEAPWVANLYYDHALLVAEVANQADDFNVAITEMKRFILLSNNNAEKREAQDRIYQWEVKRDRIQAAPPRAPYIARSATAGSSDCFIATAAYGSFLDPHVITLRQFRDRYLLTNTLGQWFVERYYDYSPSIAKTIREHLSLRLLVQIILTPIVLILEYPWIMFVLFGTILSTLLWSKRKKSAVF